MKLDQLRKIIREEVRAAVKEELQEVMNEAVRVASTPTQMQPAPKAGTSDWSAAKGKPARTENPIMDALNETRATMTQEEYKTLYSATSDMVQKPNFASMMSNQMARENQGSMPGLDLSQLGFINKAKAVLDAANEKDKQRRL